jgi:hypothetical protein
MWLGAVASKLLIILSYFVGTAFLITGIAFAQTDTSFAPIYVEEDNPEIFYLVGDIDSRTAFNFKRAVSKYGTPTNLVLTSDGGLVHEGLLLALEIKELGLRTIVHDYCMSACFYVFMAGAEREVAGDLGVHQISSSSDSLKSGQIALSDIIDVMNQLNVDRQVLVLMFQTPSDDMHVFSEQEIRQYGLSTNSARSRMRSEAGTYSLSDAIAFVSAYNRLWSETNRIALKKLPQNYAAQVKFYKNYWTRERVMKDKIAFAERWPERDYWFRPSRRASFCNKNDQCTVVGEVDWYAHSPQRSATSRGTSTIEITLEYSSGRFRITGEDGRVVSRH